jgi:hypothetical protein
MWLFLILPLFLLGTLTEAFLGFLLSIRYEYLFYGLRNLFNWLRSL